MADGGGDERPSRPWIGTYVLNGHDPVPEYDTLKLGEWMETANRHVRLSKMGSYTVSTIFLGLDHGHMMNGPPILFETMVFFADRRRYARLLRRHKAGKPPRKWNPESRPPRESFYYQTRYATWTGAELGHAVALRAVHKVRAHVLSHKGLDAL